MPLARTSIALIALTLALAACDADSAPTATTLELYVDGALAADAPSITFPRAIAGKDQLSAQLELKNLGPGTLTLSGTPPVRIEHDDRLVFSVTTPTTTTFARGESALVTVFFRPSSAGHNEARVVIGVVDHDPYIITLSGDAVSELEVQPALGVSVDGASAPPRFDFGAIAPGQTASATLTIANSGTGQLVLPEVNPVTLSGLGFTVGTPSRYLLNAGESVSLTLTFTPSACASYGGTLTVRSESPAASVVTTLVGRGGTNPQGYDGVTDALSLPDGDVALSNADNGVRRFVVGNLAYGNYNGRIGVHSWDGCTLGNGKTITPVSAGLSVGLLGAQIALDDRGKLLLATARDNNEAWLFELQPDNQARRLAALATARGGQGNGRGAALAGDASAAFIGVAAADSGFNQHGVVLVYERPASGTWVDMPEARWRLAPSNPTAVQQVGGWVEASADGVVVAAGGFVNAAGGQAALGPPVVYVWTATGTLGARTWGEQPQATLEPDTRTESVRLEVSGVTADIAALTLARDGSTIALPTFDASGKLLVQLWLRGSGWTSSTPRGPDAVVTLTSNVKPRIALGAHGDYFLVADADGAREVLRPNEGWSTAAVVGRRWNVPFYGAIAIAPDDEAFTGLDAGGRGWLVWR